MTRPFDLKVSHRRDGDVVTVAPEGDIDLATADVLRDELDAARRGAHTLLLDLRGVGFMDSSGMRLLVEVELRAAQDGFTLFVVRGPEPVQRLLELTGLAERLELVDDPSDVVAGGGGA
ncbi:MAG: anti-sigma factor antagonist [Solirubrobacteraceae bacterium]|jgi:anti-anti-sigma factor|nr:anti-sigma factor antagonist [Solirubrobacteraceae bacterium]